MYQFAWTSATPGKPQGAVHALELPFVFGTLDRSELGVIAGRTPAARELSGEDAGRLAGVRALRASA